MKILICDKCEGHNLGDTENIVTTLEFKDESTDFTHSGAKCLDCGEINIDHETYHKMMAEFYKIRDKARKKLRKVQ